MVCVLCRNLSQRSSQKTLLVPPVQLPALRQRTIFRLTLSLLVILLKVHLLLLRVSSLRPPLDCRPSNLSLSPLDRLTPSSRQGFCFPLILRSCIKSPLVSSCFMPYCLPCSTAQASPCHHQHLCSTSTIRMSRANHLPPNLPGTLLHLHLPQWPL